MDGAVTSHAQRQVQRALPLDAVVGEGAAVLQLLPREHEALPTGRNALLVLYLGFDVADSVAGLNLEGDGLAVSVFTNTCISPRRQPTNCKPG